MSETNQSPATLDRDSLGQYGFALTRYENQEGEFLTKKATVEALADFGQSLINHEIVDAQTVAIIELCPDETVQLYLPDADILWGRYPIASTEGQAILAAACRPA